jgi:hypothetical protein
MPWLPDIDTIFLPRYENPAPERRFDAALEQCYFPQTTGRINEHDREATGWRI